MKKVTLPELKEKLKEESKNEDKVFMLVPSRHTDKVRRDEYIKKYNDANNAIDAYEINIAFDKRIVLNEIIETYPTMQQAPVYVFKEGDYFAEIAAEIFQPGVLPM